MQSASEHVEAIKEWSRVWLLELIKSVNTQ